MDNCISTLDQFKNHIWDALPPRRKAAGREVVGDLVTIAVQEWPDEALEKAEPDSAKEFEAIREVIISMKRQSEFLYGQRKFAGLWMVALQILIPIIVQAILDWWRERNIHRQRLNLWRRRWRVDG